jgi:hypothetical protein
MCSIRNRVGNWGKVALLAIGVCALGGCQHQQPATEAALSDHPTTIDPAMQKREWSRSAAFYTNTGTVAGPVGFNYEPDWNEAEWKTGLIAPLMFVGQVVWLPIDLIVNPQWEGRTYSGEQFPPTYSAVPPLPEPSPDALRPPAVAVEKGVVQPLEPIVNIEPAPASSPTTRPANRPRPTTTRPK